MNNKTILGFSVAMLLVLLTATTTVSVMTVIPKRPVHTEVKAMRGMLTLESDVKKYIDEKVKQGYIVKSVALMDDERWSKAIIVVEKY